MDPAMAAQGGMPMDPAMAAQGGMPMDPAMAAQMGGMPMDPAMAAQMGGMSMDPAMAGMDPSMGGMVQGDVPMQDGGQTGFTNQGGDIVADTKQASPLTFAIPEERLYPIHTPKIASESLKSCYKKGDNLEIAIVKTAIEKMYNIDLNKSAAERASKEEADYSAVSPFNEMNCSKCKHFNHGSSTCKKIQGKVNPSGYSKHYETR